MYKYIENIYQKDIDNDYVLNYCSHFLEKQLHFWKNKILITKRYLPFDDNSSLEYNYYSKFFGKDYNNGHLY